MSVAIGPTAVAQPGQSGLGQSGISNLCCSRYVKSDFQDSRQDRNPIGGGSVNRALEGQSQDKVGGA